MVRNRNEQEKRNQKIRDDRVGLTTTLYGELRRLAAARMAGQHGPQTLQTTALLHEAWLRLDGGGEPKWSSRTHYFAAVAEAMRHILVDRARRRKRIRHGGDLRRVDLEAWNWEQLDPVVARAHDDALLTVQDALERLALNDPQTARLVKLHYFAGLTVPETAQAMDLSVRTTERRLAYARAWLSRQIRLEREARNTA